MPSRHLRWHSFVSPSAVICQGKSQVRQNRLPHRHHREWTFFTNCGFANGDKHPENHGYPSPWFTRDYGFFSPTPMYWPADHQSTRMAKGNKMRLSYRVIVFAGNPDSADITSRHVEFSSAR